MKQPPFVENESVTNYFCTKFYISNCLILLIYIVYIPYAAGIFSLFNINDPESLVFKCPKYLFKSETCKITNLYVSITLKL